MTDTAIKAYLWNLIEFASKDAGDLITILIALRAQRRRGGLYDINCQEEWQDGRSVLEQMPQASQSV